MKTDMNISQESQEQMASALTDRLHSLTKHIIWKVECEVDHWDMQFRCHGTTTINGEDFHTVIILPVNDAIRLDTLPHMAVDYITRRIAEQYKVEDYGEQWKTDHEKVYGKN